MLMIRLARHGAKKKPFYHIVAIDKRRARNAICKEKLGFYNPMEKYITINLERVKYWISNGAHCSETVVTLVSKYEKGQLQAPNFAKKTKVKKTETKGAEVKIDTAKTKVEKVDVKTVKAGAEGESKKKAPKAKAESPQKQEKTTDKKVTAKKTSKKDEDKA